MGGPGSNIMRHPTAQSLGCGRRAVLGGPGGRGTPARLHPKTYFYRKWDGSLSPRLPAASTPHPTTGRKPAQCFYSQLPIRQSSRCGKESAREIISAPLLFSGSLLYGGQHQPSSKKQLRSGVAGKGGPVPIYKRAEPGEKAFNSGSCGADLYFTSNTDRNDKPRRPGHRPSRCPLKTSHRGAPAVRHQTPPWTETRAKTEGAVVSKGCTQVDWRERSTS